MSYPLSMDDRAYEIHSWAKDQGFYDDVLCRSCGGRGHTRDRSGWVTCLRCDGKGFDLTGDPSFIPRCLALIHSEVSEALEAWRDDDFEHMAEELVDVLIRVLDTAKFLRINIEQGVINKHQKNLKRPYKNGRVR